MLLGTFERYATAVALLATVASSASHAQAADITSRHLREEIVDAAAAGRLPQLDSAALEPGVRREIRIHTGFGLGSPNHITRLWQDDRGVHGQLGVFWRLGYPSWVSSDQGPGPTEAQQKEDANVRKFIASTYGCRAVTSSRGMNLCWLDARPQRESWSEVLAQLDSAGVETIRTPAKPKMGVDGWLTLVEVRNASGYRTYWFWAPDPTSNGPNERAVARVETVLANALNRRLAK